VRVGEVFSSATVLVPAESADLIYQAAAPAASLNANYTAGTYTVRFKVGVAGTLVTSLSVTSQDGTAAGPYTRPLLSSTSVVSVTETLNVLSVSHSKRLGEPELWTSESPCTAARAVAGSPFEHQVWRCRLPITKPVLKAPTLHRLKLEWHKLFSLFSSFSTCANATR